MSSRYEMSAAAGRSATPLRVIAPDAYVDVFGEDPPGPDTYALIIGDSDASAYAVTGSPSELRAFAGDLAWLLADMLPGDPEPVHGDRVQVLLTGTVRETRQDTDALAVCVHSDRGGLSYHKAGRGEYITVLTADRQSSPDPGDAVR